MIKQIFYIEDGSVDLDDLKSRLSDETLIIVYRSGSTHPKLINLSKPIKRAKYSKKDNRGIGGQ